MKFKNKKILLDGEKAGICVGTGPNKLLYIKDKGLRLFRNMDIARVIARGCDYDQKEIKYFIKFNNDRLEPLSKFTKLGTKYYLIDMKEKVNYTFEEVHENKVMGIAYLVTKNGDTIRSNKEEGYDNVADLFKTVEEIITNIISYNDEHCTFERVVQTKGKIICRVRNTTCDLVICSNAHLMSLNQSRISEGKRCFTFDKNMDKFTTLYMYTCKDISEPKRIGSEDYIDEIVDAIICDMNDYYDGYNAKLVPIKFSGPIIC